MSKDLRECFRTLGLQPGASLEEIKSAYRQLIQRWHPDHYKPGSLMQTTAEDITKEANEAYHQLCKKKRYLEFRPRPAPAASKPAPTTPPVPEPWPDPAERAEKLHRKYRPQPSPPPATEADDRRPTAPHRVGPRLAGVFAQSFLRFASTLRKLAPRMGVLAAIVLALIFGAKSWLSVPNEEIVLPPKHPATHSAPPRAVAAGSHGSNRPPIRAANQSESTAGSTAPSQSDRSPHPSAEPTRVQNVALAAENRDLHFERRLHSPTLPAPLLRDHAGAAVESDSLPTISGSPSLAPTARLEPSRLLEEALGRLATFNLGDTRDKVLTIQGTPDQANDDLLRYGSSLVYFREGRVVRWQDGRPSLRVFVLPSFEFGSLATFGIGSTKTEVVKIQGPPSAIIGNAYHYGASIVYFDREWVSSWIEVDQHLKARPTPRLNLGQFPQFAIR